MQISCRLLMLIVLTGFFTSCWDDFEELSYNSANMSGFSFAEQDTCEDIEDYTFYIDQVNGLVYNLDSLPYESKVDYLVPTVSFYSTDGNLYLNDTLWDDDDSDTLDFTSPVKLTNTSEDGDYTRTYTITVNVHQVNPDTMLINDYPATLPVLSDRNKTFQLSDGYFRTYFSSLASGFTVYQSDITVSAWTQKPVNGLTEVMNSASVCQFKGAWYACSESGKLYISPDGLDWVLTGDGHTFVTLYGSLKRKYIYEPDSCNLIGLVKDVSGDIYTARSADGVTWVDSTQVDDDFPVYDYASVLGTTVTDVQYYTVASGLRSDSSYSTSVWSTEDGFKWVQISSSKYLLVSNIKGASLFYYDDYLVCFGGLKSTGAYTSAVAVSKDHGKNWIEAPDTWVFPSIESGQAYGSMIVQHVEDLVNDKDREFIWCFGGLNNGNTSPSVWKSYEHQMIFIRR